jgi:hypothetical protein
MQSTLEREYFQQVGAMLRFENCLMTWQAESAAAGALVKRRTVYLGKHAVALRPLQSSEVGPT